MSWFDEIDHTGAIAEGAVAGRPTLGFIDGLKASYEEQTLASSFRMIGAAMADMEAEQSAKMRKRGVKIPSLSSIMTTTPNRPVDKGAFGFSQFDNEEDAPWMAGGVPANDVSPDQNYVNLVKFYNGEYGDRTTADALTKYDAQIQELQRLYPEDGFLTSRERVDQLKANARRASEEADAAGWGGRLAGGAVGAMNPLTDPLNALTAPVAGGEGFLARVGIQAGVQAGTEALNQFTGVQEQRRLLGLDNGAAQAWTNVGFAALGGAGMEALVYGAGKGLKALGRKPSPVNMSDAPPGFVPPPAPAPQAPPGAPAEVLTRFGLVRDEALYLDAMRAVRGEPMPYASTGADAVRMQAEDFRAVRSQLEAWDGPRPWEVKQFTHTAERPDVPDMNYASAFREGDNVASGFIVGKARELDPQTFAKYDKLQADAEHVSAMMAREETLASSTAHKDIINEHYAEYVRQQRQIDELQGRLNDLVAQKGGSDLAKETRRVTANDIAKQIADIKAAQKPELALQQGGLPLPNSARVMPEIDAAISQVKTNMEGAKGKKLERLQRELEALQQSKANAPSEEHGILAAQLRSIDAELARIAPAIERAISAARGEFPNGQYSLETRRLLDAMDKRGTSKVDYGPSERVNLTEPTLEEKMPAVQLAKDVAGDAADKIRTVAETLSKDEQAALDTLTRSLSEALNSEAGVLKFADGTEVKLSDELAIDFGTEDAPDVRTMKVRDIVDHLKEEDDILGGVGSCAVP